MSARRLALAAVAILLSQWGLAAPAAAPPRYREEPPFDLQGAFGTTGDWKAVVTAVVEPAGEFDSDERPSQSKICFVHTASPTPDCTWFRELFDSNLTFQKFSSLSVARLKSGSSTLRGLVMKATALYPTGQLRETAIWVYDARRDRFRLATAVKSDEVRILSSGPLNGTLITSDWHRDEGETRWSDHRRDVAVYRYSSDGGEAGYRKALEYTTARKYGAEDLNTIDAEMADIEAKIR